MSDSKFWRFATVMLIAGLFYCGNRMDSGNTIDLPSMDRPAFAGVAVANDESEIVFTASQDGRKIYMWQYFSSKPPKFMGESQAILQQ